MLRIENLTKTYAGGKRAVDGLSVHVQKGDLFGFIGHNGAGKTTTIRAAVGVLDFDGGEIYIKGKSVKANPVACKRIIAYIPDNPDIYEHMTGIQYLTFMADVYGVARKERLERTEKYAKMFEMEKTLGDLAGTYSHGMKQKLAIIGALIHAPELLVLDEPFVGLDPKAAHTLKVVMGDICVGGGAIFFSTHVLEVAEKLCNKVAIIRDGKLVVQGETKAVRGDNSLEEVFLELIDA